MRIKKLESHNLFAPPASYSQERLWFLDKFEPSTAIYNIPYIATVKGVIHSGAFNRAVNRLISRHESLRTCFIEEAGKPRQAVYEELSVEVDGVDLSRMDPRARAERLQAVCTEVTSTPFDLSKAPLFRIMLVALPRETTIITTLHHIIADGWSLGLFHRELAAFYHEELGGRPASLAKLRIQYADYAVWQREKLEGEGLSHLKQYWSKQLEGAMTILEIPGDYARPLKQTFKGAVHNFDIAPPLVAKIRALAQSRESTLFMTIFAAFAILLYRLTGNKDVLVGTPVAGRKGADVENLIGLFVNTLVIRARMEPLQTFNDLLSDVKAVTLEAFEHQDMPFERLVLELNPKRDLSHSPLVQVLFSLQNIPPLQELIGREVETDVGMSQNLNGHTGTAKFDLALFVSEIGERLQCAIEFNTDLFSQSTVRDMGAYFVSVLDGVAKEPNASVLSYALMSEERRQEVVNRSKGAERAHSATMGCHHLFEKQCQTTPDAIALSHVSAGRRREITFAELNAYANRIARYIAKRGARSGDNVGICMKRGIDQIAALLAIVKLGAAYVPLDPEYPLERSRFILRDARVSLLLGRDMRGDAGELTEIVEIQGNARDIGEQSADNLQTAFGPEMPLYVMYTSGSTGKPKGVLMPHRSIVNLVEWQARVSKANAEAVTLQYAPLHFDVASQEIFSTLTSGGCLALVDDDIRRDSVRFLEFLESHDINRLFLPPVALEHLANAASNHESPLAKLREIIVAGDRLQITDTLREFFQARPHLILTNQYGPTESHVVSAHTLEGPTAHWPKHPAIGEPIDNVELYVLDENLEPVPPKVAGELYIGGEAVALGYLNLSEENKSRFIRNPFQPVHGFLYRSGDVCRYDDHGILTFIGRSDEQIKLRGFRIEPGEVEVVLKAHSGVKEAVVVKRELNLGDSQLVAYVVLEEGATFEKAKLRAHVGDKLPSYMIPSHFVRLGSFPLTSSGKIDRRMLPNPSNNELTQEQAAVYVAPRTPVEQFLADCWRNLLQIERVSIRDNFFELGGHSLSATQLVSRIRDRFGLELPLFRVFERSTIELLALEIVQRQASQEEQSEIESLLGKLESLSEKDSEELLAETGNE